MKNVIKTALLAIVIACSTACSDDNSSASSNTSPAEVINTVSSGAWRVTLFSEDGNNHTNDFTGYSFSFDESNILTATNGTNNFTGFWSVTNGSSSDDDSNNVDFNILFAQPDTFVEISEDWDILERTGTKVRLRHISGGDGSTDLLTFEKI